MSRCDFDENGRPGPAMYAQTSRNRHRTNTLQPAMQDTVGGLSLTVGWTSRDAGPILRLKIACPIPQSLTPCSWEDNIYSLNRSQSRRQAPDIVFGSQDKDQYDQPQTCGYARGRTKPPCTRQSLEQDGALLASASCSRRTPESWDCNSAKALPNASARLCNPAGPRLRQASPLCSTAVDHLLVHLGA